MDEVRPNKLHGLITRGLSPLPVLRWNENRYNWAFEARYPIHGDDPTEDEAQSAAYLAQGIWQAVYQDLLKRLGDL